MYYLISHILQGAENGIIFNGWFLHKKQSFFLGGGGATRIHFRMVK